MIPKISIIKLNFISFAIIAFMCVIGQVKSNNCTCPDSHDLGNQQIQLYPSFQIQNEVINGTDFGKPILISNMLILPTIIQVPQSLSSMKNKCPQGYQLLVKADIDLISRTASNFDLLIQIGVKAGQFVFSSTKTYPDNSNGADNKAWEYYAISLGKSDKSMNVTSKETYFIKDQGVIICKSQLSVTIDTTAYDYNINKPYSLKVMNNNIKGVKWNIDSTFYDSLNPIVGFSSGGCKIIQVWAQNAADQIGYSCITKFAFQVLGSDGETGAINSDSIQTTLKAGSVLTTEKAMFFSTLDCAVAPKANGDFYVLYSDDTKNTYVLLINNKDFTTISEFPIEKDTLPMDIVETPLGFAVYLQSTVDHNYSFLSGYNASGKLVFKRTIMNNGASPTTAKSDQMIFHDNKSKVEFGMDVMFSPHNGKLAYGRGRIALIFAHYNLFGYKDGKRDEHTGDSFITVDDNGQNEDFAWSWKTSHSLIQVNFYDGRYFITASLGDVYPENINVCFIEPYVYTSKIDAVKGAAVNLASVCNSTLVPGKIPGNGAGDSCGLLGGITKIGEYYYLVYSRKSCTISAYGGGSTSDTTGEIGFTKFLFQNGVFTIVNNYKLGDAANVIGIRSQKYGSKLLIVLSITQSPTPAGESNPKYYSKDESTKLMLVDVNGNIISQQFDYPEFIVPVSADIKYLLDGKVIWGVAKRDNKRLLLVNSLTPSFVDPYYSVYNKTDTFTKDSETSSQDIIIITSSTEYIKLYLVLSCFLLLFL